MCDVERAGVGGVDREEGSTEEEEEEEEERWEGVCDCCIGTCGAVECGKCVCTELQQWSLVTEGRGMFGDVTFVLFSQFTSDCQNLIC